MSADKGIALSVEKFFRVSLLPVRKMFSPKTVLAVCVKVTVTSPVVEQDADRSLAPQDAGNLLSLALKAVKAEA